MRAILLFVILTLGACASPMSSEIVRERQHQAGPNLGGPTLRDVDLLAAAVERVYITGSRDWRGTGFALRVEQQVYLITAGHVADTGGYSVLGYNHQPAISLTWRGAEWLFHTWGYPIVDVAAYRLAPGTAYVGPTITLARSRVARDGHVYMLGYPGNIHALTRGRCFAYGASHELRDEGTYFGYHGASGAPVLVYRLGEFQVAGVHVAGETHNNIRLPVSYYVSRDAIAAVLMIKE